MKNVILTAIALSLCSGCASTKIGAQSYLDANHKSGQPIPGSRVFIWDSDYSAGIGNSRGQCAQGALTATARSIGAAIDIATQDDLAKGKSGLNIAEKIETINVSSVETAYANLGYFYLCQILLNEHGNTAVGVEAGSRVEANGQTRLSGTQIQSMFNSVGMTATSLRGLEGEVKTVISPEIAEALKKLHDTFPEPTEEQIVAVLNGDTTETTESEGDPSSTLSAAEAR